MPTVPDLAELEATIARMEVRYAGHRLFADYRRLCERFTDDLSDPRDLALSKAAVLMLLKIESEPPSNS